MPVEARDLGLTVNRMRARLDAGELVVGAWIDSMRTPAIVRIAAVAGADFVFIDLEHSSLSHETVGDLCEMARACGITPVVRPGSREEGELSRLLDMGAMGILMPDVVAVEEVEALSRAALYPPGGRRGATSQSSAQDYRGGPGGEIHAAVDRGVLRGIQIESRAGIGILDEILGAGLADFVEVGRGDLSIDLGHPLETRHPDVLAAIGEIVAICRSRGIPCGTLSPTVEDARDMIARGMRSIVYPNERNLLLAAYREAFGALREPTVLD